MRTPPKVIAVLGGKVRDGRMSTTLISRLDTTIALHTGQPVVVCGGNAVDGVSEADLMAAYLSRAGISPIIKEDASTTTLENIDNLMTILRGELGEVLGPHHSRDDLLIVTSRTHVLRTRAILTSRHIRARVVGAPQPLSTLPAAIGWEIGAFVLWLQSGDLWHSRRTK